MRICGCGALNIIRNSFKYILLSIFLQLIILDSDSLAVVVAVNSVGNPGFRRFSIEFTALSTIVENDLPTDSKKEPYC